MCIILYSLYYYYAGSTPPRRRLPPRPVQTLPPHHPLLYYALVHVYNILSVLYINIYKLRACVGRQKFTFFETVLASGHCGGGLAEQMTSKYLQVFVLTTVVKGYMHCMCATHTHTHTLHKLCHRLPTHTHTHTHI